jgi:putative Holliday junction resolvase
LGRIVCVDYGIKRCGIAATDALQIAAHPLTVVDKKDLIEYLRSYCGSEEVDKIVLGHPEYFTQRVTPVVQSMMDTLKGLKLALPDMQFDFHPEDFTSAKASEILVKIGVPKKKRREKGILDKMSAVLILQDYLGHL